MEQYITERLRLRPLGKEDTDAVWELVRDEAIGSQLYCGVQRTREEAARLVQGYLDDPDRLPFAVLDGESGAFAGVLVLRRYGAAACEQTLYLGRPFWNRGFARELLAWSFRMAAGRFGAREMVNYVRLDNLPSVRVQENLGFVLAGTEEYPGCPAGVGIFRRPLTAAEVIHPGQWRHFKGGEYQVLGLARHSETGEDYVVYQALYGEQGYWVRPASMWLETVEWDGQVRPRFAWDDENPDACARTDFAVY